MRTIVLVLLALAVISLTGTDADAGSWCASYRRGVSNCSYSSYEQCRATVLGLGDFAGQIHSPERPTGRAPEAGIPPARRGVTGAAIRYVRQRRPPRSPTTGWRDVDLSPNVPWGALSCKMPFEWSPARPGVTHMGRN